MTATDLVLRVTEMLRKAKVVGKFVEFTARAPRRSRCRTARRSRTWRRSTARRLASFPSTSRPAAICSPPAARASTSRRCAGTHQAQGLFGMPREGECDYSITAGARSVPSVEASVAGPKRPQDRIALDRLKDAVPGAVADAGHAGWLRQAACDVCDAARTTVAAGSRRHARPLRAAASKSGDGTDPHGRTPEEHQRADREPR